MIEFSTEMEVELTCIWEIPHFRPKGWGKKCHHLRKRTRHCQHESWAVGRASCLVSFSSGDRPQWWQWSWDTVHHLPLAPLTSDVSLRAPPLAALLHNQSCKDLSWRVYQGQGYWEKTRRVHIKWPVIFREAEIKTKITFLAVMLHSTRKSLLVSLELIGQLLKLFSFWLVVSCSFNFYTSRSLQLVLN